MTYFVGIDGGGTRTTAVVASKDGALLARVQGPAGRVDVRQPEAGAATLAELTRQALREARIDPPATALCCALAGAGRPPERKALETALQTQNVARTIIVVGDAEAALQDAFGIGPGILLIAGTGSAAWGRGENGQFARCGGWGHLLGDEGSGYAIGLAALRTVVQAHDGRTGPTGLTVVVKRTTNVSEVDGLIAWSASAAKADIAALAPTVIALAETDSAAAEIVRTAARDLAAHVIALHQKLAPWRYETLVALTGGLIEPGRPLRHFVEAALREGNLEIQVLARLVDAARGAALLAQQAVETAG